MTTPHTPGPWTVESDRTTVAMGNQCVIVAPAPDGASQAETRANTALIAAAPDLLAALLAISAGNTMQGRETWTHADVLQEHYRIARVALAKVQS